MIRRRQDAPEWLQAPLKGLLTSGYSTEEFDAFWMATFGSTYCGEILVEEFDPLDSSGLTADLFLTGRIALEREDGTAELRELDLSGAVG